MRTRDLEIRFSREQRVNDHDIDRYTLYLNGRKIYYARYESCVIDYINEHYAKRSNARLKKKLDRLVEKYMRLNEQIDEVKRTMSRPLVKVTGCRK